MLQGGWRNSRRRCSCCWRRRCCRSCWSSRRRSCCGYWGNRSPWELNNEILFFQNQRYHKQRINIRLWICFKQLTNLAVPGLGMLLNSLSSLAPIIGFGVWKGMLLRSHSVFSLFILEFKRWPVRAIKTSSCWEVRNKERVFHQLS